jgi:hypothetical protein
MLVPGVDTNNSFPFAPHYFEFQGLRLHYLDEPPAKAAAERLGEKGWLSDYGLFLRAATFAAHAAAAGIAWANQLFPEIFKNIFRILRCIIMMIEL